MKSRGVSVQVPRSTLGRHRGETGRRRAGARIFERLGTDGLRSMWFRLLYGLNVYRCCIVQVNRFDAPSVDGGSRIAVACARLERCDINEYIAFRPDQDRGGIQARFDADHSCFIARRNGRIIAASWACTGRAPVEFLQCNLLLADGVFYAYDNYVLREFRGRRVIGSVIELRDRTLRAAGCTCRLAVSWRHNRAAYNRLSTRGHNPIGVIGSYGLGPWRRQFLRLDPPAVDPANPPVMLEVRA